jgi:branched-chain amino acid transport system permease protein
VNQQLSQVIVSTLFQGSLYALVGMGFVVLYRATGVVNFAQGGLMVAGSFVFYAFAVSAGLSFGLALVCATASVAGGGAGIYFALFRRMTGATSFVVVIATLGLNILLTALVQLVWGTSTRNLPAYLGDPDAITIGAFKVSSLVVFAVATAIGVGIALEVVLRRTKVGLQMRAVASNVLLATFFKVRASWISAMAWAIAGGCATIAGVAYSLHSSLDSTSLQGLGLLIFAPILLGGLDSVAGAIVGGLLVALIQALVSVTLGGEWSVVVSYATILLVLVARPQGILGSTAVTRL